VIPILIPLLVFTLLSEDPSLCHPIESKVSQVLFSPQVFVAQRGMNFCLHNMPHAPLISPSSTRQSQSHVANNTDYKVSHMQTSCYLLC